MNCPKCKNKISENDTRCPMCGERVILKRRELGALVSIPITIGCISIIFALMALYAVYDSYFGVRGNLHAIVYALSILVGGILNVSGIRKKVLQTVATVFHGIALLTLIIEILLFASSIWMVVIQMIVFILNIYYVTKIK